MHTHTHSHRSRMSLGCVREAGMESGVGEWASGVAVCLHKNMQVGLQIIPNLRKLLAENFAFLLHLLLASLTD